MQKHYTEQIQVRIQLARGYLDFLEEVSHKDSLDFREDIKAFQTKRLFKDNAYKLCNLMNTQLLPENITVKDSGSIYIRGRASPFKLNKRQAFPTKLIGFWVSKYDDNGHLAILPLDLPLDDTGKIRTFAGLAKSKNWIKVCEYVVENW